MNSKHQKTLAAIFSLPTPGNLEWRRIEALFVALNAKVIEGSGSRVSFIINDEKATSTGRIPARKLDGTR